MRRLLTLTALLGMLLMSLNAAHGEETCLGPMRAVGSFAAGFCYQTHTAITLQAEGFAKGAFSEAQVSRGMEDTLLLLANADRTLMRLAAEDILASDKQAVSNHQKLVELLREEAQALLALARDTTEVKGDAYLKARERAWTSLSGALGLEEKPVP